jgi:subfamily B ATP-binding cassette protein HlyB/CyaB
MLRERRLVRDLCISAFILSLFALAPILFWRILSDKVVYYSATNTFVVVCLAMATVTVFEAVFGYLRQFLLTVITTKVDARLSEYMFDKVLRLPIDFFERTQVGTIGHDMNEFYKIRTFLTGQLFGTLLDSMTLLIFLPVMFYFSPLLTFIVLAFCALIVVWLIAMLPLVRRVTAPNAGRMAGAANAPPTRAEVWYSVVGAGCGMCRGTSTPMMAPTSANAAISRQRRTSASR